MIRDASSPKIVSSGSSRRTRRRRSAMAGLGCVVCVLAVAPGYLALQPADTMRRVLDACVADRLRDAQPLHASPDTAAALYACATQP